MGRKIAVGLWWVLRILLSAVFVYAGVVKMRDAHAFADSVASFRLLPDLLVVPAALTLPPLEILSGLLALSPGRWGRAGTFCLSLLTTIFAAALVTALARGLQIDCGCFGADHLDVLSPTKNLRVAVGRDILLGLLAWSLYWSEHAPRQKETPVVHRPPGQMRTIKTEE